MSKIVKTKNIKKTLKRFANENGIVLSKCYFKLSAIETQIKDISNNEFVKFNDIQEYYHDKQRILNEHVEFKQIYTIDITQKKNKIIKLNYKIKYDTFSTHPKMFIETNSIIPYKKHTMKETFLLLVQEINSIKAENSILVKLFDESMMKAIKAFTKHLYNGKFTKKIKIPLFDGIEPEVSNYGELILWFEKKKGQSRIIEVEVNELLVQFIKPKYGRTGFNAYGQHIDNHYGKKDLELEAYVDENSIKIIENDDKITYRSRIKGYVNYDGKSLSVDNKLRMQHISRLEDALTKDEDNEIEVQVFQNNTDLDTVGEGVKLKSQTVSITGHIGAKSVIEAVDLQVDGVTHRDSKQFAKYAKINRHKGMLKCHVANIALLEGGVVHATTVNIHSSLGGTVYAQDVTISNVKHNLKVYASNSITIKSMIGEDNQFIICYKEIDVLNSKVNFIEKDIEDLKELLEEAKKHDPKETTELQNKINELEVQKKVIINSVYNAKITIEKPVRGYNIINFKLPNSKELLYKTQARKYEPFYLEVTEDKITLKPVDISVSV